MRILVIANFDVGLFKFRKELLSALINLEQGNEVYCALPMGELVPQIEALGCKFIETPSLSRRGLNPFKDISLYKQYLNIMDSIKPDYVITYTVKCNIYGGIAAKVKKIPYSLNVTGLGSSFQKKGPLQMLVKYMYSLSNAEAQKIFFENTGNARIMYDAGLVRKDQIVVNTGAGVNIDEYPFCDYPEADETVRFVFIGRVMLEKGVNELFHCAARLKKEYGDRVEFHIVGPFEDNYSEVVHDLSDKGIIIYHGFQSDVRPFIKNSHCFVLPSWHEGMANTLLESGSSGRPLITTDIHGCKEAVVDGVNGYLFAKQDEYDLYAKLKEFIELPYGEKVKMGAASREHIKTHFNKVNVLRHTINALGLGE